MDHRAQVGLPLPCFIYEVYLLPPEGQTVFVSLSSAQQSSVSATDRLEEIKGSILQSIKPVFHRAVTEIEAFLQQSSQAHSVPCILDLSL